MTFFWKIIYYLDEAEIVDWKVKLKQLKIVFYEYIVFYAIIIKWKIL